MFTEWCKVLLAYEPISSPYCQHIKAKIKGLISAANKESKRAYDKWAPKKEIEGIASNPNPRCIINRDYTCRKQMVKYK